MKKTNVFIGRQTEVELLGTLFEKSLAGQPQLIFISGESGIGKSSLLKEFSAKVEASNPKLITAVTNCNGMLGKTDPFSPLRSVVEQLLNPRKSKLKNR